MKLVLPASFIVFAAASCCCCSSDLIEALQKQGLDVPTDLGGGGAATGTRAMSELPAGEKVKILDIDSEDAYYGDRATIIGKECVTDEVSSFKDGGWHGGSVHCTAEESYYFYKAAYMDLGPNPGGPLVPSPTLSVPTEAAAPPSGPPPAGAATTELPSGTRVKIIEIASDDAYYSDKGSIIGKLCTLQEQSSAKDGGWQGGSVKCDGGSDYYFYKAAYQAQ